MITMWIGLILLPPLLASTVLLPEYEHCNAPLGMESGSITDDDLSSSSSHDASSVGPQMARIRTEVEGGAWCPEKPVGVNSYEYLQIELGQLFFLNAIETQGRFGNGQGKEYAEYYQVQYQRDNQSTSWITYTDKQTNKTILNGNINTYLAEKRTLSTPILAKRVRILPFSSRWRTVCMRVELYGCPFYGGVVSYTASPSTDRDKTYDGEIGKLVDGVIGGNDQSWVGWNKSPVSISFHFDRIRQFKSIQIYTMNKNYQEIQIRFDENSPIQHRPKPTGTALTNVFSETIEFTQPGSIFVGQRVELRFEFTDELFMLTEIRFDSELATSLGSNTTLCPPVKPSNSTLESSSLVLFTFEWLTVLIVSIFSLGFVLLLLLGLCRRRQLRHRRRRLRQNSHLYYKSSQMTATTSGSCGSTSSEHDAHTLPIAQVNRHFFQTNNYDDVTSEQQSMGSYIYPITSTTSLLRTSSSLCKGEQYAVIDGSYSGNPYQHWSTNNTFHYASLDIGQMNQISVNRRSSLFNCVLPTEVSPSSTTMTKHWPADLDQSKLMALRQLSETSTGEIYLGDYLINQQSQCVLIKAVKTNLLDASRETFLHELELLSRVQHANLSCLVAVQLDHLYFVQEHSHFGTLQDYSRTLSNQSAAMEVTFQKTNIYFAYQLASALQYLSHCHFIHGDVAARNCLFYPDFTIKLTDCAVAFVQYQHEYWTNLHGQLLPLRWMSTEALMNHSTLHSDIYSFAVTLWELWSRCSSLPYASLTNEEVYQHLLVPPNSPNESCFHLCVPPDCPKEIYDLLCECWHRDGNKRPSIDDITLYFRRQIDASLS